MKTILVTGGSGFLGAALCRALAARGDAAVAFDRAISPALERVRAAHPDRVSFVPGDVSDMAGLCRVLKDRRPDAAIHAAAVVGVVASMASAANVMRVNVEGTINLWEAMALFGVRRCVHISSEETYGHFTADRIDETHRQEPLYAYGVSKVAVEHLGRTYAITHGIETVNIRTSWVYGPDFPRMRIPRDILEAAVAGRPLHLPHGADSRIDHTYIDDFVDGTLAALDHPEHPFDAYHVASAAAPTVGEMVAIVRDLFPGADISVGPGAYRHAGTIEIPRKGALDCARAREVFGYRPRFDLAAGLAAYADSLRAGG
jgi:UDP-glucose 4-epimerase